MPSTQDPHGLSTRMPHTINYMYNTATHKEYSCIYEVCNTTPFANNSNYQTTVQYTNSYTSIIYIIYEYIRAMGRWLPTVIHFSHTIILVNTNEESQQNLLI